MLVYESKWVTLGEPMSVDSEPSLRPWRAAHSGPSGWHSVNLWVLTLSHPSDHEGQHTVGQVGDTRWTYEYWLWAIPPTMKGSTQWAKWVTLGEPMSVDSEPSLRPWRAAHSEPSGWHSVNLWVLTLSHPSDHEGQHTVGQVGDTRWTYVLTLSHPSDHEGQHTVGQVGDTQWTYECWLWAIPPTMKGSTQWAKWVTLGEPMSVDSEPSLRPWRAAHSGPSGWHYECWLWAIPPTMKGSTQWAKWVTLGEPMSVDSEPSLRPWRAAHSGPSGWHSVNLWVLTEPSLRPWRAAHSGPSGWHSVNLWVLTLSHPSDHEGQHTVGQVGDTRWTYECWLWAIPPTMKGSTQWAKWVTLSEPMSVDSEPSLRPWRAAHSEPSGWHSVSLWVLTLSHPSDHEGQHTVGQVGDTRWTYECWLWAIPPTIKGSTQWAKWVTPRPLTSLFIGS